MSPQGVLVLTVANPLPDNGLAGLPESAGKVRRPGSALNYPNSVVGLGDLPQKVGGKLGDGPQPPEGFDAK